jgi:acyl-coenzyme A synthetase/AMP-(fatty) acid ligase
MLQLHLSPTDRVASLYPPFAGPGVTALLMALLSGASFHPLAAAPGRDDAIARIAAERITLLTGIPALLRLLLSQDGARAALASLRGIYVTSDALHWRDVLAWRRVLPAGCALLGGYGLTEAAPLASYFVPEKLSGTGAHLPIGHLNPDLRFAIVEDELWVRSDLLALGEWRDGRCVPGRMQPDPADPDGAILRTGDLVRRRADGTLELLGRVDAQVKIRGHRVEPDALAAALCQHDGVTDAAAIAVRAADEISLVAFVVAAVPGDAATLPQSLAANAREMLPAQLRPARIHLLDALPRLPGGKIDSVALEKFDAGHLGAPPLLRRLARRAGWAR